MDPASVLFSMKKPEERLNSTDADYVETIQASKLGFFEPIGSVAFYPNGMHWATKLIVVWITHCLIYIYIFHSFFLFLTNCGKRNQKLGGRVQPGCSWDEVNKLKLLSQIHCRLNNKFGYSQTGICSHSTTYQYFAQTITFDIPFYGDLCNSLDDVKKENCSPDLQARMGGEPGPSEQ